MTPARPHTPMPAASRPAGMMAGGREFVWGAKTYVMAALNITPDSFSGDGLLAGRVDTDRGASPAMWAGGAGGWVQAAVDWALRSEDEGADIIDIGGESTRPRSVYTEARLVSVEQELERVQPVISSLKDRLSAPICVVTRKAEVARAAAREGAALVNDVSMLGDTGMARAAAETGLPIVISHTRAKAEYVDVMTDIIADLSGAVSRAEQAGVARDRIIIDPGIGFAKTAAHSLEAVRRLNELRAAGLPILVGTSRKSFIGDVLDLPVSDRLEGTAATVALAIALGADIVRVHDVRSMARVARMSDAVVRGWRPRQAPSRPRPDLDRDQRAAGARG